MVNVPPLISTTPPPIDFDEDDDQLSTFNFDTTPTEDGVSNFNLDVEFEDSIEGNLESKGSSVHTELGETDLNDNIPSLKLDSLSLCSNESNSQNSTVHKEMQIKSSDVEECSHSTTWEIENTKVNAAVVTLEDFSDDCSDICSSQKYLQQKEISDFFGIHVMEPILQQKPKEIGDLNAKSVEEITKKNATFATIEKQELCRSEDANTFSLLKSGASKSTHVDFNDTEDFTGFCEVVKSKTEEPRLDDSLTLEAKDGKLYADDDDFDDFQEFENITIVPKSKTNPAASKHPLDCKKGGDFDDFNDGFSETTVVSSKVSEPTISSPVYSSEQLEERVMHALQTMFPSSPTINENDAEKNPSPVLDTLNLAAIEQSIALNHQWVNSGARFALIKSLGIDSRNILFGDKWNSTMPRFAANLSFDPLQPLKTQTSLSSTSSGGLSNKKSQIGECEDELRESTLCSTNAPQHSTKACNGGDSNSYEPCFDVATPTPSTAVAPGTKESLSFTLSANGNANQQIIEYGDSGHHKYDVGLSSMEQVHNAAAALIAPTHATTYSILEIAQNTDVTSTIPSSFAVPLKETHIFTPSKSDTAIAKTRTVKTPPVEFDFEIASAGIVIDETVVKKEYRDVEYNPTFVSEISGALNNTETNELPNRLSSVDLKSKKSLSLDKTHKLSKFDDEFSDFQFVPPPPPVSQPKNPIDQMILSPAVLLPQAVQMPKSTIEWGDVSTASINSEELARIEELFPLPKRVGTADIAATKSLCNNSARSSPAHRQAETPTISATIDNKERDDDEWCEFISVPVQQSSNNFYNNNNINQRQTKLACSALSFPQSPATQMATNQYNNPVSAVDDDWSDFVCNVPPTAAIAATESSQNLRQKANFYSNPLGFYDGKQSQFKSSIGLRTVPSVTLQQPFFFNHLPQTSANAKK